ncbi:TIGR01459 family HAD-type hydrolase [Candidatus Cardinium hertigii]|nr:TIGR01459 family HAD-type hydrolase [Candidatus Cardinium hertigii]
MWGVIVEGTQTYPGVVEHINYITKHNKQVFFVYNAPVRRSALLFMLQSWHLAVNEEQIITAGSVAAHMIVNSANLWGVRYPFIYHLLEDINYLMDAEQIMLTTNIHKADLLLLTLYCDQTADLDLNQWDPVLETASIRKIPILGACPDIGIMQQGVYRYCAGYFAEKVKQWGERLSMQENLILLYTNVS